MPDWVLQTAPDTGTITVMPFTIYRRLRLKPEHGIVDVVEPMRRWFLRWAKRNNCGIAPDRMSVEDDRDVSRRESAAVASVQVFKIPAGSGLQPGEIVNIQEETAVLPDLQGPWMDELDKSRGYKVDKAEFDLAAEVQKSLGEVELAEGDPPPAYS